MNYGEVLSSAWKIIWKHKVLWIFGILASLGQGGGGNSSGGSNYSTSGGQSSFTNLPPGWADFFGNAAQFIENMQWWAWVLIGLALIISLLFLAVLSTLGEGGLVRGAQLADSSDEKLTFGLLFQESRRFFWRIFWFGILTGLVIALVVLLFLVPVILIAVAAGGDVTMIMATMGIFFIAFCCIFIPLALVAGIIVRQSINAMVLDDVGILEGFKRGWRICWRNPGPMILLLIILGVASGIVSLVISLPLILAFLPILLPVISGNLEGLTTAIVISAVLCCAYLPVYYLVNGILTAFTHTAWALTYLRLTRPPADMPLMPVEILPEAPPMP